jgi:RNA polymerase sigma factor (sigma-70 family)
MTPCSSIILLSHIFAATETAKMQQGDRDYEWLEAIRSGDKKGLTQLYQYVMPSIVKLVIRYGGTEEHARDLFQDTILILYKKLQYSEITLTSSFSTFFIAICRNLWANHLKKKSNNHVTFSDDIKSMYDDQPDWYEVEEQSLQTRMLYKALNKLGDDCRQLLELFFQKVPMDEIMIRMKYGSYEYVRRRKFMCKNKLIEFIKNDPSYKELTENQKGIL